MKRPVLSVFLNRKAGNKILIARFYVEHQVGYVIDREGVSHAYFSGLKWKKGYSTIWKGEDLEFCNNRISQNVVDKDFLCSTIRLRGESNGKKDDSK